MINANELRIGNYITFGKPYVDGHIDYYLVEGMNGKSVRIHRNGQVSGLVSYERVNPIPLTPEILEKAGFVKDHNHLILEFPVRMMLVCNDGNIAELDFVQDGKHISFKCGHILYAHQLQNLYFALTGTELIINL